MTENPINIIWCVRPDELHHRYPGQTETQSTYIELDLVDGSLLADFDGEVGRGVSENVVRGFERRYGIPVLTGDAANDLMREIAPLAERILADWERAWMHGNPVAVLGSDALEAESEIEKMLGLDGSEAPYFTAGQLVAEWDLNMFDNSELDEYGITAKTSDDRLEEIEKDILSNRTASIENPVSVCPGLTDHLRQLRDDLGTKGDE